MSGNLQEPQPEPQLDRPALKTPDFWRAAQRKIIGLPPETPAFVSYQSVLEDPETQELAIDRQDWMPHATRLDFKSDFPSIGVVRIVNGSVDGYIADLRYTERLQQRRLYFDDPYEDSEQNKSLLTQPLFGVLFVDWTEGTEAFLCQAEDGYVGEDILATLKTFVDEERARRGLAVFGDVTNVKHAGDHNVYGEVRSANPGRWVREDLEPEPRPQGD